MRNTAILMAAILLGAAGGVVQAQTTDAAAHNPAPADRAAASAAPAGDQAVYTVPAGTKVLLALKSAVNTRTAQPGDGVYLVSTFPVVVGSRVLIPAGVYVQGVVDRVRRPGRVKGRAAVHMHFTTMIFPNNQVIEIPGVISSLPGSNGPAVKDGEGTVEQAGSKGKDVENVLKGAAIGAEGGAIGGAVSGAPGQGIGYGSAAGAVGGLLYTLFTRGNEINIQQGTPVEMVLQRPLVLKASQLAGIEDTHGRQEYVPAAQPRPMKKPHRLLCPIGSLGCE